MCATGRGWRSWGSQLSTVKEKAESGENLQELLGNHRRAHHHPRGQGRRGKALGAEVQPFCQEPGCVCIHAEQ